MRSYTKEELKKILDDHAKWISRSVGGVRANLSNTDLSGANLSNTDLFRANLSGACLFRANLSGANLSDADLSNTDLSNTDLSDACLSRANLSGADLSRANFETIHADFVAKLLLQKYEVAGLLKAIIEGRVDGSTYEGDCACFVGTIANVKACHYSELIVKAESSSPTERFFLAIKKGDTPENNPISEIVADWIIEFLFNNEMNIPHRDTVWG